MHIFFSGIGGTAIGPLALIAKKAGYRVSGSDKQNSGYIDYLKKLGITDIYIGQAEEQITKVHEALPIDWVVFSSAVIIENPSHPEIEFAKKNNIKYSKRDELLNKIIEDKNLKLIAIAGTHGKTTTTAMVVWLFKQLGIPISYSVGAKIPFGDMGEYDEKSEYFVYEADEFDNNFLSFYPYLSLITGVSWDHHEIFTTVGSYKQAFNKFLDQSRSVFIWDEDFRYLAQQKSEKINVINSDDSLLNELSIFGAFNRRDALLAYKAIASLNLQKSDAMLKILDSFPGLQRRMEKITEGLYSDYAHTPEKIRGAMSTATEIAKSLNKQLVIVYEPLTNRRQHFIAQQYKDCFDGAKKIYWVPSYLAREDDSQKILKPSDLIQYLSDPAIAVASEFGSQLEQSIQKHLANNDMVVCLSGGGGNSLDEWVRQKFST